MKKITVLDFCNQISAASEEVTVKIKDGSKEIGKYKSLYKVPAQAIPEVLGAKITYITIGREEITIQVKT